MYTHLANVPFNMPKPDIQVAQTIKELSRLKYGTDRAIVEAEISSRAELADKGPDKNAMDPFGGGMPSFPGAKF